MIRIQKRTLLSNPKWQDKWKDHWNNLFNKSSSWMISLCEHLPTVSATRRRERRLSDIASLICVCGVTNKWAMQETQKPSKESHQTSQLIADSIFRGSLEELQSLCEANTFNLKLPLDEHNQVRNNGTSLKCWKTALHLAASEGHLDIVKWILTKHSDMIDLQDRNGWTPLHCAAHNAHLEVCMVLLKKGISWNFYINLQGFQIHWK